MLKGGGAVQLYFVHLNWVVARVSSVQNTLQKLIMNLDAATDFNDEINEPKR